MKRHRQIALVSVVQGEETTLEPILARTKPNCIILVICNRKQDNTGPWMIQSLHAKVSRSCTKLGLEDATIITIIGPHASKSLVDVSQFFSGIFSHLTGRGFDLVLDLTDLEKKWMILLYNAALRHRPCVHSILMMDGDELIPFWIYKQLTKAEKTILEYLFESHPKAMTPSEITEEYLQEHGHGQGSFISKILRNLNEIGLIQEDKEGRYKFITLSDHGLSLFCPEETKKYIQTHLSLPSVQNPFSSLISSLFQERIKMHEAPSLDKWLSFLHSTYFLFSDFQEATRLGFKKNEGLAFYLCQAISEMTASGHLPTVSEIDKKLMTKIRFLSSQAAARNDVIYHPTYSRFLNEKEPRRQQMLKRILALDPRIKTFTNSKKRKKDNATTI